MVLDIDIIENYLQYISIEYSGVDMWIATVLQYCKLFYFSNTCISNNDYLLMLSKLTRLGLEKDINK